MSGGGDRELLIALNGELAGKTARAVAVDLFGAARAAEWATDAWVRSRTRRRLRRARRFRRERKGWDYRAMAAGPG